MQKLAALIMFLMVVSSMVGCDLSEDTSNKPTPNEHLAHALKHKEQAQRRQLEVEARKANANLQYGLVNSLEHAELAINNKSGVEVVVKVVRMLSSSTHKEYIIAIAQDGYEKSFELPSGHYYFKTRRGDKEDYRYVKTDDVYIQKDSINKYIFDSQAILGGDYSSIPISSISIDSSDF